MLRDQQRLIIFLPNNEGYTAERAIHGATQRYTDIAQWSWTALRHAPRLQGLAQSWRIRETVSQKR